MKINNKILLLLLLAHPLVDIAQDRSNKVKNVSGSYTEEIPSHLSLDEAKQAFSKLAMRNAITKAFGPGTVLTTDRIEYTTWEEEQFHTETEVYTHAEWIGGDPEKSECIPSSKDGKAYLTCNVSGKARSIDRARTQIKTHLLRCPKKEECRTQNLDHNKPFYLFFRSPTTGYLTVFLQYQNTVQQLVPYANMKNDLLKIERDTDYILLSKEHPGDLTIYEVDEFMAYTEQAQSIEKIILIFSPNKYAKPPMNTPPNQQNNQGELPPQTTAKAFGKWLQNAMATQQSLQQDYIHYRIIKP